MGCGEDTAWKTYRGFWRIRTAWVEEAETEKGKFNLWLKRQAESKAEKWTWCPVPRVRMGCVQEIKGRSRTQTIVEQRQEPRTGADEMGGEWDTLGHGARLPWDSLPGTPTEFLRCPERPGCFPFSEAPDKAQKLGKLKIGLWNNFNIV